MKKTLLFNLCICFCLSNFSQEKSTQKPLTGRGNSFIGIGISLVESDVFSTSTDIDFSKYSNSYGLLPSFSYATFIDDNFMIGGMLFTGFYRNKYSYDYTNIPGVGSSSEKRISSDIDLGVAPFARYYVPFNKRGSVSFFMQGALPFVHSISTQKNDYVINGVSGSSKNTLADNTLRGSIGFGLAVKTKFGAVDTHLSNMGWFISFNKLLKSK